MKRREGDRARREAESDEKPAARHQDRHAHLLLLSQHSVQSRMVKFHEHDSSLHVASYSTCSKGLLGIKVNPQSGECLSCSCDQQLRKCTR